MHPNSAPLTEGKELEFILSGKAEFSIKSARTGEHYTYRVRRRKPQENETREQGMWFVNFLGGRDNERDWRYLGCLPGAGQLRLSQKSEAGMESPVAIAFSWTWERIRKGQSLEGRAEIWHSGKCGRCGRKLTVPESIRNGLGPECAGKGQR